MFSDGLFLTPLSDTIPLEIRQDRPIVDDIYKNGHIWKRFLPSPSRP
jgi:hypothetical protein